MPLKTSFSKRSFRTNSYYFLNKKEIFFITVENVIVKTFELKNIHPHSAILRSDSDG